MQNCKISYGYIRYTVAHGSSLRCSVNNCFENQRATMKSFLLKSVKNPREQVHFYQHCRPVNCVLTKKWLLCWNLSRLFLSYSNITYFSEPLQAAASEPSRTATRRILCMKATLFRQNSFICSRGVNRLIISRLFLIIFKDW